MIHHPVHLGRRPPGQPPPGHATGRGARARARTLSGYKKLMATGEVGLVLYVVCAAATAIEARWAGVYLGHGPLPARGRANYRDLAFAALGQLALVALHCYAC